MVVINSPMLMEGKKTHQMCLRVEKVVDERRSRGVSLSNSRAKGSEEVYNLLLQSVHRIVAA